jgi:integrase
MAMLTEIGLKARIKKIMEILKSKNIRDRTFAVEKGLSMRVFQNGRMCFQYRYSVPGGNNKKRAVYGDYPDISLKKAREMHAEANKMVRSGVDINAEKVLNKLKRKGEPTIAKTFKKYQLNYLSTLKSPKQTIYIFKKDILPNIGLMKVCDLRRDHIVDILMKIVHRGAPVKANKTLGSVRTFLRYCVESGVIENNPADKISKKFIGGEEKSRDRYLAKSEIKAFWEKIDTAPFSRQVQLIMKILLLTGQRVGEVTGAEWSEIDFKNKIWTIPAEKSKTRVKNLVPLHDESLNCFRELSVLAGQSPFVSQSPNRPEIQRPLVYTSIAQAVRHHYDFFGFDNWTPHDLRRTVSTWLNDMGVMPHVVEKILNHKMQGVMAVYNKAEYWEQRVEALKIWQEKIKQIIAGEKIIPINRKKDIR